MQEITVSIGNRKLKATWTPEAQQDLRAFHSLDLEEKLTEMLEKELTAEIDNEIIADLRNEAKDILSKKKKKALPRAITDDWEPSRFD
jgi:hypothetical protein